jgi:DNA-binding NtrC family response regulator
MEKNYKIVILDDNIELLDSLNKMFEKNSTACDVYCFSKVDNDLWNLIEDIDIDLFIIDIRLGDDDGRSITERIIEKKRGSVFLFISGYNYTIDSLSNFKGKCVYDFMAKPIVQDSFISRIVSLLNIAKTFKPLIEECLPDLGESDESIRTQFRKMVQQDKTMIKNFRENMYNPTLQAIGNNNNK